MPHATGIRTDFAPLDTSISKAHSIHHYDSSDHESLRLIGTTRFEPLRDVNTILITGGAGFMLVYVLQQPRLITCS